MRPTPLSAVFLIPAAVCAAWTVFAGKDLNWDLLNYHYYSPFSLLAGRLQQDFFAASAQSYLNPLGYVPFYLMVASGWHSVLASIVLALAHSLAIALLYLIAWRLFAHLPGRDRVMFSCLATALGTASSVFWATVGTSFLDPLLLVPMLGGLLVLLGPSSRPLRCAALAGALFGAAAALKYSNAVFALAALPLALALPGPGAGKRLRAGIAYAAGGALAVGLLAGPWLVMMLREFGNPVFPLFNAWFQSPHAPAMNGVSVRFTPHDWAAAAAFPFRMLLLDRSLYSETFAPDLRFAALVAGAIALPILIARRRPAAGVLRNSDWRAFAFLAAASVLWLASSANARYGMVVLLLAGVCLARIIERAVDAHAARIALLVLLAVQLAMVVTASPSRWFIAAPWSSHWLPFQVPERALREPALYLTVEFLPMAAVAPFVHPAASFVNLRGQHSLATDSPRLATLLASHQGRVRALGRGLEPVDGRLPADQLQVYDATLRRIGYGIDPSDCFTIAWRPDGGDFISRIANRLAGDLGAHEPLSVASCALRLAAADPADLEKERAISVLFDRIEKACPVLFRGQTAVTEPLGGGWSRFYSGLDARLEANAERAVLNRHRHSRDLDLGRLSDWARGDAPVPQACRAQ
jgi:hypothetical protein